MRVRRIFVGKLCRINPFRLRIYFARGLILIRPVARRRVQALTIVFEGEALSRIKPH